MKRLNYVLIEGNSTWGIEHSSFSRSTIARVEANSGEANHICQTIRRDIGRSLGTYKKIVVDKKRERETERDSPFVPAKVEMNPDESTLRMTLF